MNSLFLAALTLFFAQGLVGRDKARAVAAFFVAALAATFLISLAGR